MISAKGLAVSVLTVIVFVHSTGLAQTGDATRIFNQAGPGTVSLIVYDENKKEIASGAAFAIGEDILATSYHLVSRAYEVEALTSKGKKAKVEGLISSSKTYDIALLKIKGKLPTIPAESAPEEWTSGSKIFAVGPDENRNFIVLEGSYQKQLVLSPELIFLDVAVPCPETFCGGSVFDSGGRWAGLLLVIEKRLKCIVPASAVLGLSRQHAVASFKSLPHEDYFGTFEGASLAGRLAAEANDQYIARIHLEKAVRLDPARIDLRILLARVYAEQRDFSSAAEAYSHVLTLDETRADVRRSLASVYVKMQRYKDAVPLLEKSISANPGDTEAYYDLGTAYEENGEYAKAFGVFEKYMGGKPEKAWDGYLHMGRCLTELKEYEKTVPVYEEALKLNPGDIKVNYNLAEACVLSGQLDKAEKSYQHLAEIDPEAALTYYGKILQMYDGAGR